MVIGNFESLSQPEEINEFVIFPSNPAERLATLSSGCYLWYYPQDGSQFSRVILAIYICLLGHLAKIGPIRGKISAQAHTTVKQICFPMAMSCFCHCYLSPRTECIMKYGAVRKFHPIRFSRKLCQIINRS